jgi:hypothetical protein
MKNLIFLACLLFAGLQANAQSQGIDRFFEKYKSAEGKTNVQIEGDFIKFIANFANDDENEVMKKITKIRVLVMEEENPVQKSDYDRLMSDMKSERFEELIKVRDGKDRVDIYVKDESDIITDVAVLVNGEEDFVLLSIEGNLKMSDLKDLDIDMDGGDHFDKIRIE